jgi:hypothetical protein
LGSERKKMKPRFGLRIREGELEVPASIVGGELEMAAVNLE